MGALPDWAIERDVVVKPLETSQSGVGVISHGLGSYGLDIRCGYKFKVFTPTHVAVVDPKAFDPKAFVDVDLSHLRGLPAGDPNKFLLLPPHSFCLAESVEWLEIPRDAVALVFNKSTYARCGIVCPATVLEPEWKGIVTLEIANTTPLPAKIYPGEGIAQVIFVRSDGYSEQAFKLNKAHFPASLEASRASCRVSYADKGGRFQDQTGLTLPFVKKE